MPYAWPHSLPSSHYHGGGYQRGGEERTSDMTDMTNSSDKRYSKYIGPRTKEIIESIPQDDYDEPTFDRNQPEDL